MVAVVSNKGSFFKGLINYVYHGRLKDRGSVDKKPDVITFSDNLRIPYGAEDTIGQKRLIDDFIDQAKNHRSYGDNKTKYVGEHILSFRNEEVEKLGRDKIKELCEQYILDSGLNKTQYLAISHGDTDIFHIHIVFNRCQNDRTLYTNWKEKIKAAERAVALSLKYRLTLVGNQEELADTNGVLEARAKHDDILSLMKNPIFQNIRNHHHLAKVCEAHHIPFVGEGSEIKIGDKSFSKRDLDIIFFINRKTKAEESKNEKNISPEKRYNRKNKSTIPDYERKKVKSENFQDEQNNIPFECKNQDELIVQNNYPVEGIQDFSYKKAWGKSEEDEIYRNKRRKKR